MPSGKPEPERDVRVTRRGATAPPLDDRTVQAAVSAVLDGEAAGDAAVSVTFLSGPAMRGLNRRTFGRDRATDVIAFPLAHPGRVVGDIYICPSVARRGAEAAGIAPREELLRLVVHGTLHVLGYEHPADDGRETSAMWRCQERYVTALRGSAW